MCAYGRALLDILFTKEQQAASVVLRTPKSSKPPLPPNEVKLLFGMYASSYNSTSQLFSHLDCVKERYPEYDHKALMATLGQKCRDVMRKE